MGTAEGGFLCRAVKRLPPQGEAKTAPVPLSPPSRVFHNFFLECAKSGCPVRKKGSKKARLAAGLFA